MPARGCGWRASASSGPRRCCFDWSSSTRLSLDDTVERRLPGLLPAGGRITLRQLLNHTSGLIDTNDVLRRPDMYLRQIEDPELRTKITAVTRRVTKDPGYEFSPRLWVELAAALPLLLPPGSAYHYSNIGYIVAGLVAERAGGGTLPTLFRRQIITPLHLSASAYDPHARISGPHASGYRVAANGGLTDTTTWTFGLGANGGIVSNARDEARFLTKLMRGELLAARPTRRAEEAVRPEQLRPRHGRRQERLRGGRVRAQRRR